MNFDFTDDQQAIKRTANELLAARFKPERVRELAEAERVRRRRLEGDLRARLGRHLHRRGARRPGARDRRARDPDGGARLRARAGAVPVERRRRAGAPVRRHGRAEGALAAGHRLRRGARHRRHGARRRGPARAGRRHGRGDRADRPRRATSVVEAFAPREIEPFETMDRTAPLRARPRRRRRRRSRATASPRATGSRRSCPAETRRRRAEGDGDGSRIRARPQAVRPPDRLLPGRIAPLRADAARGRGLALGRLLRRVVRGRRAGVARARRVGWRRPTPQTPAGACAARRCRCTAASASPGSTTCTSS